MDQTVPLSLSLGLRQFVDQIIFLRLSLRSRELMDRSLLRLSLRSPASLEEIYGLISYAKHIASLEVMGETVSSS